MNKKRTLAVVMAAATVGTSVAPVFASTINNDADFDTISSNVKNKLNQTFDDINDPTGGDVLKNESKIPSDTLKSKYEIYLGNYSDIANKIDSSNTNDLADLRIKDVSDLQARYNKAKANNDDFTVSIINKGYSGNKPATTNNLYSAKELLDDADALINLKDKTESKSNVVVKADAYDYTGKIMKTTKSSDIKKKGAYANSFKGSESQIDNIRFELQSGSFIDLKVGGAGINTENPLDKNKTKVDFDNGGKAKDVYGFGVKAMEENHKLPRTFDSEYTVDSSEKINIKASDIYSTESGYTKQSAKILNAFHDSKTNDKYESIVYDNKKYSIKYDGNSEFNSKQNVTFYFTYKKDGSKDVKNAKLIIESKRDKDLLKIQDDVDNNGVVDGKVKTLGGEDRFESAISISKESYDSGKAKGVVLVGENAIVDGLTSAPLAHKKSAPVLITKKDKVPQNTIDEINRVIKDQGTIYIVGGRDVISDNVISQLKKEFGNNVITRLSGSDRFETSANIAKEIGIKNDGKAYVVGENGLADAMSISSVAAAENAPILITPQKELGDDAQGILSKISNDATVDLIGGKDVVSDKVMQDVFSVDGKDFKSIRIAGDDREGTNAAVIDKFADGDGTLNSDNKKVYVAKDGYVGGDDKLIDALALAPLAAKDQDSSKNSIIHPLVLVGKDLSKDQKKVLKKMYDGETSGNKLIQGGLGIVKAPVDALVNLLGLNN